MPFYLSLFILFFSISTAAKTAPLKIDWTIEALRLTGESDSIKKKATKNLLKIKNLKKLLQKELKGPRFHLALDVISSLGFEDFLPELLLLAKTDNSGVFYLSIDSLITPKNQKQIAQVYRERLLCAKTCGVSPASEVLLLDTLVQIAGPLSPSELKQIFTANWYEVQSAVLSYVRVLLLRDASSSLYLSFVQLGLESPIIQLRWQSLYLIRELSSARRAAFIKSLNKCRLFNDPKTPPDVIKLCGLLTGANV